MMDLTRILLVLLAMSVTGRAVLECVMCSNYSVCAAITNDSTRMHNVCKLCIMQGNDDVSAL